MAFSNGPKGIVTDGLVFCIDAGNKQCYPGSGTKVDDIVLNCTGALDNATYSPDNGGCFTFDGTDDQLDMDYEAPSLPGDATICWWFRAAATQASTHEGLVSSYDYWTTAKPNNFAFQWYTQSGNVLRLVSGVSGNYDVEEYTPNSPAFSGDTWFYVCVVHDDSANTLQPYWNGTTQGWGTVATDARNLSGINEGISIGHYRVNGSLVTSSTLDGEMGPVYIYNKALTASEITQNYNAQKSRFGK